MRTEDFDYYLPEELIAQVPVEPRDSSRLLVLDERGGVEHRVFGDILNYINKDDVLVMNETKVIPARLIGEKTTGAKVEVFLLKRLSIDRYECLVRPGRRLREGARVVFGEALSAVIENVLDDGNRIVRFECDGALEAAIDKVGRIPLPPYITSGYDDIERYNTVYARCGGSAAAPTAGLHFTDELLSKILDAGVKIAKIVLHVGLGTFRPVQADDIFEHKMHSEWYSISEEAANIINNARGRVICVGTTSCRAVESAARRITLNSSGDSQKNTESDISGKEAGGISEGSGYCVAPCSGDTDIFIYPGYEFKLTDALITNFHLPKSTLIMLVSALAGRENTLAAYREAVERKYRFFSFGDAMFVEKAITAGKMNLEQ